MARVLCLLETRRREIIVSLEVKFVETISKELNSTPIIIRAHDVITQNISSNILFHLQSGIHISTVAYDSSFRRAHAATCETNVQCLQLLISMQSKRKILQQISSFHCGKELTVYCCYMHCGTMQSRECVPIFRKNIISPPSGFVLNNKRHNCEFFKFPQQCS